MSAIYDNWERLVAAVLKKEQLWQLFHAQSSSSSSSISSDSSSFSFHRLTSSLDDVPFSFSNPEWFPSNKKDDNDDFGSETGAARHSRKRDLKIQVPQLQILDRGFSRNSSPTANSRVNPRGGHSESRTKWHDHANRQSYPLPLPPAPISNSSHVSRPNSAAKLSSTPLRSAERAENAKRPGTTWKKGRLIGRGPLGDAYLGFNSEKGEMCAMKEVSLSSDDKELKQNASVFEKELELLSRIKHPNIVQYYGYERVADNFHIYYEYISGGPINKILQEYGRLRESVIRSYTQQILSGLAYLHSEHIVHRDIKCANILVDPNGRVKLINFGIEKHIIEQSRLSSLMDSPYWMAPEVRMNLSVRNLAVDIWSLGCTVLEMATSKPPLSHYDRVMAMHKVAYHNELPKIPHHLSDACKDFLKHCLQRNPLHRATASQLLEHPFVKYSLPLGKRTLVSTSPDHPTATNAVRSEGTDHARGHHQLNSRRVAPRSYTESKSNYQTSASDIYTPRNISAPVSPVSPLLHPRSPQHLNGRMSPPPKTSPHTQLHL